MVNHWVCKKRSAQLNGRDRGGFTLVDLLTVMLIIGVLTGLVLGLAGYANKKAALAKTHAQMERLKIALENYRADWGRYPLVDEMADLRDALYEDRIEGGRKVYIELNTDELNDQRREDNRATLLDPWGQEYRYRGDNPDHNIDSYDLESGGPDGDLDAEEDNLTNWRGDTAR